MLWLSYYFFLLLSSNSWWLRWISEILQKHGHHLLITQIWITLPCERKFQFTLTKFWQFVLILILQLFQLMCSLCWSLFFLLRIIRQKYRILKVPFRLLLLLLLRTHTKLNLLKKIKLIILLTLINMILLIIYISQLTNILNYYTLTLTKCRTTLLYRIPSLLSLLNLITLHTHLLR